MSELDNWMKRFANTGGDDQGDKADNAKNVNDANSGATTENDSADAPKGKKKKGKFHVDEEWPPKKNRKGLLRNIFIAIFVLMVVSIVVSESIYTVKDTQTAVITTFGDAQINPNKGLQFKVPFFQELDLVNTTVQGFTIGYGTDDYGETYDVDDESIMITSDYNFLDVDFYVSYMVTDPVKYLYASDEPELILKNIAMTSIRSTLSAYTVDAALTTGKSEIQANIKQMIIGKLEVQDIGISLNDALIQDVEPPTQEVANAFKAVETAKQNKESAINEANQYRNEQLPAAEAKKDAILQKADADKTARINEANGQVARFNEEYEQYKDYPLITKQRMFYETMEDVLPSLKVVIDDGKGDIQKYYPIESFVQYDDYSYDNSTHTASDKPASLGSDDDSDESKEN